MATNTDDLVRQLVEALEKMRTSSLVYAQETDRSSSSTRRVTQQNVNISASLSRISDQYRSVGSESSRLAGEFNKLRAAAMASSNRAQVAERLREISQVQQQVAFSRAVDQLGTVENAIKSTASALVSTTGNFIRGIQQNADAASLAGGVLSTGLGLVSSASQATGRALGSFTMSMWAIPNAGAKVVAGLSGLGSMFFRLTGATAQVAQFGLDLLNKEIEKTTAAFSTMVNSGALFSDGLGGIRKAAHSSGLTMTQFSSVVKATSGFLAELGMGVGPAAQRIGAVFDAGGNQMKNRLQNLGFTFEEQGVLIAETMRDLRQSGERLGTDPQTTAMVARETEKYATNLRILSAITGEDAKKRVDQARQAANTLAFQQKLATMDATQRKAAVDAMANMSELQQKNFMDMVVFGTVVNKEGAAAQAMSQGLTDSVQANYRAFEAGQLTPESVREVNKQYGEQIKADMLSLKEIGIAAAANVNSLVTALGNIFGVELSFRNKATPEAIADAERTAREQRETQDKFTNNLNSAARTAQKFAIEFENLASNLLPSYSKILDVSLRLMAQFVANASGFVGGEDLSRNMRIFLGKMNENNKEYNKQLLSGMTLEGAPEQRRQALLNELESTQEISQDRLNQIRSEVEELYRLHSTKTGGIAGTDKGTDGNPLSAYSPNNPLPVTVVGGNIPSAAYGGLVSGPKSGFLAMLHGKELVIPEGGMIPVKNNNTAVASDTTVTDRLVEILSAQTQKYDQMIEISNNMLRVFGDQLNTSREILNNSYT